MMKLIALTFLLVTTAHAAESHKTTISSYNGQTSDSGATIVTPKSLQEIQDVVLDAKKRSVPLRVKGASHSTSSLILSDGIYLSTEKLTGIISIDQTATGAVTAKVKSGTKLGDLADQLAAKGYSLGFAYPAFRGLTIGGLLATGSHGSSRRHTAVSSQNLRELTLVDGAGQVRILNSSHGDAFRAAQVNLGLMGVVHDVTLEIYPDFNLQYEFENQPQFLDANGRAQWGREADSEIVMWSPVSNRAVKYTGDITTLPAHPSASNHLLGDSPNAGLISDATGGLALATGRKFSSVNAMIEKSRLSDAFETPFIVQDRSINDRNVSYVGRSSKMLLSEFYSPALSFTHTEFEVAFPLSEADAVLGSIREIALRDGIHFPISRGLFMRFAKSAGPDGPLLSHIQRPDAKSEVWVFASMVDYRSNGEAAHGNWTEDRDRLLKEISARHPLMWHWGKNTDELYQWLNPAKDYGLNTEIFRKQVQDFDPDKLFSNRFSSKLGLSRE